jgi:hypothetical protein
MIIVRGSSELQQVLRAGAPLRRPQLRIAVPHMAAREARSWESRLDTLREDCGCRAGAFALAGFVFCFLVAAVLDDAAIADGHAAVSLAVYGGGFVGGVVLSALAGKLIGLWLATVRFRRVCRQLQEHLRAFEARTGMSRASSEASD